MFVAFIARLLNDALESNPLLILRELPEIELKKKRVFASRFHGNMERSMNERNGPPFFLKKKARNTWKFVSETAALY